MRLERLTYAQKLSVSHQAVLCLVLSFFSATLGPRTLREPYLQKTIS